MEAINTPVLFNYHDRDKFEMKYFQLLSDAELILGTKTRGIEIIANRFLEHWKYEPIYVLLKFIDELTKGVFKKVHKNVLDLPTLNNFFIEFKGPYIEALEHRNRSKDKTSEIEVDYEKYKTEMKNEKSESYRQSKRFALYLEGRYKKDLLHNGGIVKDIKSKPGKDPEQGKGAGDTGIQGKGK
jgi:hypothetical protein